MNRLKLIHFVVLLLVVESLYGQGVLDEIDELIENAHQVDLESSFARFLDQVDKRVLGVYRTRAELPNGEIIWVKTVGYDQVKVVVEARSLKWWSMFIEKCRQDPRAARRMLERVWNEKNDRGSLLKDLWYLLPFLYLEIDEEFVFEEAFPNGHGITDYFVRCLRSGAVSGPAPEKEGDSDN